MLHAADQGGAKVCTIAGECLAASIRSHGAGIIHTTANYVCGSSSSSDETVSSRALTRRTVAPRAPGGRCLSPAGRPGFPGRAEPVAAVTVSIAAVCASELACMPLPPPVGRKPSANNTPPDLHPLIPPPTHHAINGSSGVPGGSCHRLHATRPHPLAPTHPTLPTRSPPFAAADPDHACHPYVHRAGQLHQAAVMDVAWKASPAPLISIRHVIHMSTAQDSYITHQQIFIQAAD